MNYSLEEIRDIGERIRYAREHALKTRKLSQVELARKLGCSRDTIRNWERGRVTPDNERLKAIARICNVDWKWLLLGDVSLLPVSIQENIENSLAILSSFNPYKTLEYLLTIYGYDLNEIHDKIAFYNYIEKSVHNSADFYIQHINQRKEDEKHNETDVH